MSPDSLDHAQPIQLQLPLPPDLSFLRAGDRLFLTGPVLTMREAAQRRLTETWERGGGSSVQSCWGDRVLRGTMSRSSGLVHRFSRADDQWPHGSLYTLTA